MRLAWGLMAPAKLPRSRFSKDPKDPKAPKTPRPDIRRRIFTIFLVTVALSLVLSPYLKKPAHVTHISYSSFLTDASQHHVLTAVVDNASGTITGTLDNGKKYTVAGAFPVISKDIDSLHTDGVEVTFTNPSGFLALWGPYLIWILIFGGFMFFASRQARSQMNGMMSIGRSKAKQFDEDRPKTTFDDVAGYDGVKDEISEVVDFLKNPDRYKEMGASIPKGILLVGPPGTGKTMLARAVAGEAGVPFFSVSGSDFMEMFVGIGASRVRDLFATARKNAPAIIFVDEIDSIGRRRGTGIGGGHDEREQTLNQMLSEMDGFDPTVGIIMMAATNRPDILDPALLRPGRFDREIVVPLPDLRERLPILAVHSKNKKLSDDVSLEVVARGTPGMSGADLANLVNEAALHAVRENRQEIRMIDFERARDRVTLGQERATMVLSDSEKRRIAFHESGHAVLAYVLPKTDPLHKITIIPRGMALGVTWTLPSDDAHISTREEIEDSICMAMGGRVAELLIFGDVSTGASNDLAVNTQNAYRMVDEWGMSKEVGPVSWSTERAYSDRAHNIRDEEVKRILLEQESRAIEVLTQHQRGLEALAQSLLENETLDGDAAAALIDAANGSPVHPAGTKTVGTFSQQMSAAENPAPSQPE